jgi:hypothetical protein
MTTGQKALRVLVDGVALPEEEGRELWKRFSEWMEDHKGDLAGFAASQGYASIRPATSGGAPVLVASRTEAQIAYGNAKELAAKAPPQATPKPGANGNAPKRPYTGKRPGEKKNGPRH